MQTLLTALQTVGAAWRTGFSGQHLFAVETLPTGATLKMQFLGSDKSTWIDVDTAGEIVVTWSSDGQGRAVLAPGLTYRFVASAAGGVARGIALSGQREAVTEGFVFI